MYSRLSYLLFVGALVDGLHFDVEPTPPGDSSFNIDPKLGSASIEFSTFLDYSGTPTEPNLFTRKLFGRLGLNTGEEPLIRVGGNTQDRIVFREDQDEPLIQNFEHSYDDQPVNGSYGPRFFDGFQQFAPGTKFTFGINLGYNGSDAEHDAVESASLALRRIGSRLESLEIGNEANVYGGERRPANYSVQDYVREFRRYSNAIEAGALGGGNASNGTQSSFEPFFRLGDFVGPVGEGSDLEDVLKTDKGFNPQGLLGTGVGSTGKIKSISMHKYFGDQCTPEDAAKVSLVKLMNHTETVNGLAEIVAQAQFSEAHGYRFYLGETNSIACQGLPGVSNGFGASLWALDYLMYAGSQNISRVYLHQGSKYRYSMFQPIQINETLRNVRPPYYANVALSEIIGNQTRNVQFAAHDNVSSDGSMSAYSVYKDSIWSGMAVISLRTWNETTPYERPSTTHTVQLPLTEGQLRLKYLSGPGANSTNGTTWDGRTYDYFGDEISAGESDRPRTAKISNGTVSFDLLDSEAVYLSV